MAKQAVTFELYYSSAWHELDNVRIDDLAITRGLGSEGDATPPQSVSFSLLDPAQRFNPRNPASDLYGLIGRNTPARISIGGTARFAGEIASWQPRRTVDYDLPTVLAGGSSNGGVAWVEVEVAGPLRRLGAGDPPEDSAALRAITGLSDPPIAYWPLEDDQDATEASPGLLGLAPGRPIGTSQYQAPGTGAALPPAGLPRFGGGLTPAGSRPGVSLTEGGRLDFAIPAGTATSFEAHFTLAFDLGAESGVASSVPLSLYGAANGLSTGIDEIQVEATGTQVSILFYEGGFLGTLKGVLDSGVNPYDGVAHHYAVYGAQSGSNYVAELYLDGVQVDTLTINSTPFLALRGATLNPIEDTGDHMPTGLAHLAVWAPAGPGNPPTGDMALAAHGYVGETAGNRLSRLADEEGVAFGSTGDLDESEPMGPQLPRPVVALMAECAATDGGILSEQSDEVGLHYRTRADLYTQDPALTVDYSSQQIGPDLAPDLGDRYTANDVTVKTPLGITARAVLDSGGPLAVDTIGRVRREPADINVASYDRAEAAAGWHLHLGTTDSPRYPRLVIDLDSAPALVTDVNALTFGDVVRVTGVEHSPVDLLVIGWSERVGTHRRLVDLVCVPAGPWTVAEVEHATASFLGSDGSTLASNFTAGSTSMSVAVAAGHPLWVTGSVDFDVATGGVVLSVTSISGASSPQTFTVAQTPVNGLYKTVPSGSKVDVYPPAYIGM